MKQAAGPDQTATGSFGEIPGTQEPRPDAARIAYLEGQIDALRAQIASLEAADEHHRVELAAAHAGAAEAQAGLREARARLEERGHLVDDLRKRAEAAEAAQDRAERERAAVIEALGRRAKRRLGEPASRPLDE